MRYDAQTLLWDEFACDTVDAIRLVVYSDKRTLQPLDELLYVGEVSLSSF